MGKKRDELVSIMTHMADGPIRRRNDEVAAHVILALAEYVLELGESIEYLAAETARRSAEEKREVEV